MRSKSAYQEEKEYEEDEWRSRNDSSNGPNNHSGYIVKEVDVSKLPSDLLKNLIEVKPQEGGILSTDDLKTDGQAWVLQCPKNVELQTLLRGRKINLNGNPTVLDKSEDEEDSMISSQKFESIAHSRLDSGESISLLLPDVDGKFKIASVPLRGYIMIREHIEEMPYADIKVHRKKMHKLPSGIKERHPIYGIDFSHASCLTKVTSSRKSKRRKPAESYSECLKKPVTRLELPISSTNGKPLKHIVKEEPSYEEELIPTKTKKSKKRKREEYEDVELVEEEVTPIKSKKAKKLKYEVLEDEGFYSPRKSKRIV